MRTRLAQPIAAWVLAAASAAADAANLLALYYDAPGDQLVATIAFRGTRPDHDFRLLWGECHKSSKQGVPYEIAALVIDADGKDAAKRNYTVLARFDLSQLDCRPARVTLRVSPRISRTVLVPARPLR